MGIADCSRGELAGIIDLIIIIIIIIIKVK